MFNFDYNQQRNDEIKINKYDMYNKRIIFFKIIHKFEEKSNYRKFPSKELIYYSIARENMRL